LKAPNEPIYEGCSQSKLPIAIRMLAARANWPIPQRCVDFFGEMFAYFSPSKDNFPKNYYETKRLAYKFGLEYRMIDFCKNGCMLYYNCAHRCILRMHVSTDLGDMCARPVWFCRLFRGVLTGLESCANRHTAT
jgi:hypothetical protein